MKIKNIIVLTDFSGYSANAVFYTYNLLKKPARAGLKITLLNIFKKPRHKSALLISVEDILQKDSETGLKKQAEQLASLLNDKKIDISIHSEEGEFKKIIHTITGSLEHLMIVAGIPSGKYSAASPLLFIGQDKCPVLLVPETCSFKPLKDIILLHDGASINKSAIGKTFNSIIPKEEIKNHHIRIHGKDMDTLNSTAALRNKVSKYEADLIIIIPSPGSETDQALFECRIKDLVPSVEPILNKLN